MRETERDRDRDRDTERQRQRHRETTTRDRDPDPDPDRDRDTDSVAERHKRSSYLGASAYQYLGLRPAGAVTLRRNILRRAMAEAQRHVSQ
eukprot:3382922-Rhodomonas_salina.1